MPPSRRFERLAKSGIDLGRATFATEFGRSLEYYSGLVFQIEVAGIDEAIAGGGRYDGLLAYLGAPREVPAIGSAIHTERLLAAVREGRVMAAKLLIAVPSKGRLKDQAADLFERAGHGLAQARATSAAIAARSTASTASRWCSLRPRRSCTS